MKKIFLLLIAVFGMVVSVQAIDMDTNKDFTVTTIALDAAEAPAPEEAKDDTNASTKTPEDKEKSAE
jgi:hypothetical protein